MRRRRLLEQVVADAGYYANDVEIRPLLFAVRELDLSSDGILPAKELTRDLTLSYNKTRQANITKEVSEIASGAAALAEM